MERGVGKSCAGLAEVGRVFRDIDRVVAEPLELGSDLIVLVEDRDVVLVLQVRQESGHITIR